MDIYLFQWQFNTLQELTQNPGMSYVAVLKIESAISAIAAAGKVDILDPVPSKNAFVQMSYYIECKTARLGFMTNVAKVNGLVLHPHYQDQLYSEHAKLLAVQKIVKDHINSLETDQNASLSPKKEQIHGDCREIQKKDM